STPIRNVALDSRRNPPALLIWVTRCPSSSSAASNPSASLPCTIVNTSFIQSHPSPGHFGKLQGAPIRATIRQYAPSERLVSHRLLSSERNPERHMSGTSQQPAGE